MNNIDNQKALVEVKQIFQFMKLELDKLFESLGAYNDVIEVDKKEVWVYNHIKKLRPSFDLIFQISELDSISSLCTMLRMIVDNYAILYLFTSYSFKDEQLIRYYLYLLDALQVRSKLINNSTEMSENSKTDSDNALRADEIARKRILVIIAENQLDQIVNDKILQSRNWKFKDSQGNDRNNKYKWIELYKLSKIPERDTEIIQEYYSSFVHGLGISFMLRESDDLIHHVIYTLEVCNIILSKIMNIIIREFHEETKLVDCHSGLLKYSEKMNWE
jgi:hypothetical protein